MSKIYFARSINGLAENDKAKWEAVYAQIAHELRKAGHELTDEFVVTIPLDAHLQTPQETYVRDVAAIHEADILLAEISVPSVGVGYEVAYAEAIGKPIVCIYNDEMARHKPSSMVVGNLSLECISYTSVAQLMQFLPGCLACAERDETRDVLGRIYRELVSARKKHKALNSVHEAYAVIMEEIEEFWDEVKKRGERRDKTAMAEELVQVAAMCIRTIEDQKLFGIK